MNLQKILWNEAHWNINKAIAKEVWIEWALILSHLIEFQNHFEKKWKLVKTKSWDWFFSQTEKQIENQTFVWRRWQDKAIKILKEKWFLEQVLAWNPARKHFKINSENILNFLVNSEKEEIEKKKENSLPNKFVQNVQTEENDKQDCTENPNKFVQNEQTIYKEEKEINKKDNNTNVLLWAEAQKKSDLENFLEIENQENKEPTQQESDKSSAAAENEKQKIKEEIDNLIFELKGVCEELWLAYNKDRDRQFWKHILRAEEFWIFSKKIWQTRIEFAKNILKASDYINYYKWACSWPKMIYQNYSEVYNKSLQFKKKLDNKKSQWIATI